MLFEECLFLRGADFAVVDDDDDLGLRSTTLSQLTRVQLASMSLSTLRPPAAAISASGMPRRPEVMARSSPLS